MKKTNNPVAKYARDFNKAVVMKDRKKAEKKGDRKHKGKYQEDTDVVEDKKGLWDRIHAKRKRGEKPAKPGDKDYPKTLDVGESVEQFDEGKIDKSSPMYKEYQELKKMPIKQLRNKVALVNRGDDVKGYDKEGAVSEILRAKYGKKKVDKVFGFSEGKNTPNDGNPCWDTHKKVGTKMKGGKRVNDCVPKNESTAAYGKSQSSIRDKKKNAGISSSDKNKLGKLSALMSKEKESEMSKRMKRGQRNDPLNKIRAKRNEEVEQVDEAKSPSTVKHKGKTYYPTGKTGKDSKTGAPSFEYSSDQDGDDVRVWYNSKTKKVAMESVQVDEEMSAVEKRKHMNLKKRAKQGNSQAKIRLKKFEDKFKDDLEGDKRSAKQSTKAIKGKGAADPHSGQAFTGKGSGAGDDDNLVSQLRKAQDVDGNLDIRLPAGNKTARLPKAIIDKLLAGYDRLQKPEDKKKFKVLLTKELRKKAK